MYHMKTKAAPQVSGSRSQPFLIRLFQAIIAFKRMVAKRRHWEVQKKQRSTHHKATLLSELHQSQKAVKYAGFGRDVIDLDDNGMKKYREDELRRLSAEREKKLELLELKKKRRGGVKALEAVNAADGIAFSRVTSNDPFAFSVADKIKALKSRTQEELSRKMESQKRALTRSTTARDNISKDVANIIQKNVHISKHDRKGVGKPTKIRSNLKNMKKLDLQEVLNYVPGTAVYFGATVAFQSRHGGFLSFSHADDIKASAHKILPSARFMIWNCDDLTDHGIVRYGDALWLQAGVHEVLGAQYGGKTLGSDGKRKIEPALINCRNDNFFKAQQYGRWIVLNRQNPTGMLGEQVLHHDQIMLEQEWCFLASHTPYDAFMEKYNSFENAEKNSEFFHPIDECQWKLHLVTLPSDDNPDSRFREYLLEQAKDQIKLSGQDRRKKESVFNVSLSKGLPAHLKPEGVVAAHMPHLKDREATQRYMLRKYDEQALRNFSATNSDPGFLREVYGPDSVIYRNAKASAIATAEEVRKRSWQSRTIDYDRGSALATPLIEAEEAYWDAANCVLMNTESWACLPSSMQKYEDVSQSRREVAARILQRFFRERAQRIFSWRRTFRTMDGAALTKIRQADARATFITLNSKRNSITVSVTPPCQTPYAPHARSTPKNYVIEATSPMVRPDTAPNLLSRQSSRVIPRRMESWSDRPTTAPAKGPMDATEDNFTQAPSSRKLLLRSNSSMSATMAARKMIFGDQTGRGKHEEDIEASEQGYSPLGDSGSGTEVVKLCDQDRPECGDVERADEGAVPLTDDAINTQKRSEKMKRRKKRFEEMIFSLAKNNRRNFGLPKDVFHDFENEVNVRTSVKFLRVSSSSPAIYGDIAAKKRRQQGG